MVILTFIRRLCMLVCIILFFVFCVMWLLADGKNSMNHDDDLELGALKIYTKSDDESGKLLETLKGTGYKTQVKSEDGSKNKQKGYVVVGSFKTELAKSVAEYLKANNYKSTIKPAEEQDYSLIQIGNEYTSKAQAEVVVKKLQNELSVKFKTEPVYEKVKTRLHYLLIEEVDEKKAEELKTQFKAKPEDIKWEAYADKK
ncbi:MAG: hypothetical protein RDV48_11735 [Candidatus Eremiobacteraeota bacterium]|nr:hypothetical protein [Candidatus Eremiobacteraeota bacterium]